MCVCSCDRADSSVLHRINVVHQSHMCRFVDGRSFTVYACANYIDTHISIMKNKSTNENTKSKSINTSRLNMVSFWFVTRPSNIPGHLLARAYVSTRPTFIKWKACAMKMNRVRSHKVNLFFRFEFSQKWMRDSHANDIFCKHFRRSVSGDGGDGINNLYDKILYIFLCP